MANSKNLEQIIATFAAGKFIILRDDESRENEGDLVIAADFITPEAVNFMARHGCGLICLPMAEELIDRFQWPLMTPRTNPRECAFTNSIDAAHGITTGISAADRARTIQLAINPNSTSADLVMPGHIFPLKAKKAGVLARAGHTEGAVDLAKLAGLTPAAVICEIMNLDGSMARMEDLETFSRAHQIPIVNIKEIIDYRLHKECLVMEAASTKLPIPPHGEFTIKVFTNNLDQSHHIALIKEPIDPNNFVLTRLHSECFTGDLFGSARCDCGWQLDTALEKIGREGGVLLYLKQEGRGIGLINKLKAYNLQDQGLDTVDANIKLGFDADERDYWVGAQILHALGITKVKLLTNNPEKISDLQHHQLQVERVPLVASENEYNKNYLATKHSKLKHLLG
jgi:3,4-dihydroxy 2-butanone 4-phosphate synthase/GTP cyclohydrolase II